VPGDQSLIFIGIRDAVVALDEGTGAEIWRASLAASDYVTVLWDGEALIAANVGEVWRLDPATGRLIWHNKLKGLGRGLVSLASSRFPSASADVSSAAVKRREEAASG
jgi:outer membrane protein assembly factor BamB